MSAGTGGSTGCSSWEGSLSTSGGRVEASLSSRPRWRRYRGCDRCGVAGNAWVRALGGPSSSRRWCWTSMCAQYSKRCRYPPMVSSTERTARLGDRAFGDLLDRFRAVVRDQLQDYRGREVDTRGDDFLATFDGPARAIRCGRAIRDAARTLGVDVRSDLHTGEIELRNEGVGGIAVNIGARVSGLAGPGEVLASRTVVDLVAGSGLEFDDRGDHELKGVPGIWRLCAVTG